MGWCGNGIDEHCKEQKWIHQGTLETFFYHAIGWNGWLCEEIEISDEKLPEGSANWKLTLIGCVVGTEISWSNMDKFIKARWKGMSPPTLVKRNGVFLFQFQNQEDLNKIYGALMFFVFDHPLLLKRYEQGMKIGRHLFDLSTVWIRLPS